MWVNVMHGMKEPKKSADVRRRIVDALLVKSVVPFLGAGFTYGARHPCKGWKSEPNLMSRQLQKWLSKNIPCTKEKSCETYPEKTICNLRINNFLSRLAEIGHILFGAREVCETLHIHEYATLCPEPQHRYLAYLVREGLVDEIITTNYDYCFETAFKGSFGPGYRDCQCGVVRNIEEYRRKSSQRQQDGQVVLYKINGCAQAYELARTTYQKSSTSENKQSWDAEAWRIILTERQLQSFRDQNWARDMICDRFRSHHLVFIGFGSEEPQIRHTVLALIEEFTYGCPDTYTPEEAMNLPNAPFLHSYKGPLSFPLLQMLLAFMDAHSNPRYNSSPDDRLRPLYRNILAPEETDSCLNASTVMKEIFQEVFIRLVHKALEDGNIFPAWLREMTPVWRTWTDFLYRIFHIFEFRRNHCSLYQWVLSPVGEEQCFTLGLQRYLWCIRYPESTLKKKYACPPGWYMSLREDPLFILLTLLWICLFYSRRHEPQITPYGLRLTLPADKPADGYIHLMARDALRELQKDSMENSESRLLRLIIIPSLRDDVDRWGRWRQKNGNHVCPGRWIAIESGDLIQRARQPQYVKDSRVVWSGYADVLPRKPAARIRRLEKNEQ